MATNRADQTKPIPGYQNPQCYARALGGCCLKVDREHYLSRAILERIHDRTIRKNLSVLVQNLSFQKQPNALAPIGVSSLTANILCKVHNNALSDYDTAGLSLYEALDTLDDESRNPILPCPARVIDGDALERWMLKTFIGGLYSGNFRLPAGMSMKGVEPPLEMLAILYGGAAFPGGLGLFWVPPRSELTITSDDMVVQVQPVPSQDGKMVGSFRALIFGFEFNLLTTGLAPGVPTIYDAAAYRPAGLRVEGCQTVIRFRWRMGAVDEEIIFRRLAG